MKISVVIFTRNRKGILKTALEKYKEQTYQNFEIILLDNGSTDGTPEMIKEYFPEINYTYFPDNIFLYAFNYGVTLATGDLIWRTDDDAYPQSNTLFEDIVNKYLQYPEIDIVAGEIFEVSIKQYSKWYGNEVNVANISDNLNNNSIQVSLENYNFKYEGYKINTFLGGAAMIRKKVFEKIGGFWDFGFEELDFSTRAIINDFNIRLFPQFVVNHYADTANRNLADRKVKYYKQITRYFTKYFPLKNLIVNMLFVFFVFNFYVFSQRLGIFAFFEGNFGILNQFFSSFRTERQVVTKKQLIEITMGKSYVSRELYYLKSRLMKKIRR